MGSWQVCLHSFSMDAGARIQQLYNIRVNESLAFLLRLGSAVDPQIAGGHSHPQQACIGITL